MIATAFAAAPAPVTMPMNVQQQSSMPTPPTSASGTPANTSPVSPRATWAVPPHLQLHSRQLRPQKQPMYIPAVLRPTEKPAKSSPPKNTVQQSTAYGSPESLSDGTAAGQPSQQSPEHIRAQLSRIVTEEWNEENLGPVTGAPSRNHWKVRLCPVSTFFFASSASSLPPFGRRSRRRSAGGI
jgi:hypothetical protein